MDGHAKESTRLRGGLTPVGEKLLDLADSLFSVEITKTRTTIVGRTIDNIIGCVSVVTTFVDHSLMDLLLDFVKLGTGEEAIGKGVTNTGEKDGIVVGVGLAWGKGSLSKKGGRFFGFGQ